MHEKCLNDLSLFERILIYVYLKLFSRDGARDPWTATDPWMELHAL